jgi:hypothetical protein
MKIMSKLNNISVVELVDGDAEFLRSLFPPQTARDGSTKYSKKSYMDASGNQYKKEVPLLVNRSALIRAIIRAEKRHCDMYGKPERRTIRDFWYSHIKVPLMRAEGEAAECVGWGREASLALSSIFSKLVLEGELRYIDINIEDKSREIAGVNWWKPHPFSKIIVYVEKESTFDKLKPVTDTYNITLVTGKGFVATAALEGLMLELERQEQDSEDYTILLMADYDAYGFKIGTDVQTRLRTLGMKCKVQRCAIYPNQVSKDVLLNKTFPIPLQTPYDKEWCKKFGITRTGKLGNQLDSDGNITERGEFGIELQALEGAELRALLIEHLKKYAPESEMVTAVIAEQKEGADEESAIQAAEKILRDRNDVRYRIIRLCNNIETRMRRSVEVDERKIRKALEVDSRRLVYSDEYDEHLEFDTEEMLAAALDPESDFYPDIDRTKFLKEIKNELVELFEAMDVDIPEIDELEEPHDMIVKAEERIKEILKP